MTREPWEADHAFSVEAARAAVERCAPTLAQRAVAPIGEGWDYRAYLVGEDWIFRFPKRAEVVPWMQRELRVLPTLAPALGVTVSVPRFEGEPGDGTPYPFIGHRLVAGMPLDRVEIPPGRAARTGTRIGGLLARLHAFPLSTWCEMAQEAPPLGEFDPHTEREAATLERVASRLPPAVADALAQRFAAPFPAPPDRFVVCHRDLLPEHVILDPVTARISGVIDWSDMGPGDPAGDLAGLWSYLGEDFLGAALEALAPVDDPAFADRSRRYGLWLLADQVDVAARGWRPASGPQALARLAVRLGV